MLYAFAYLTRNYDQHLTGEQKEREPYFAIYACVGRSAGSQPILIAEGSSVKRNCRSNHVSHKVFARFSDREVRTVDSNPVDEHTGKDKRIVSAGFD